MALPREPPPKPRAAAGFCCMGRRLYNVSGRTRQDREQPGHTPLATFVLHLGYSWSPGSTLKEMGTRSARRLAQKASHTARCTALYTTSKPVSVTNAMGRQHNSTGKSHCVGVILLLGKRPARRQKTDTQRSASAAQAGRSSSVRLGRSSGLPRRTLTQGRARPTHPRGASSYRGLELSTGHRDARAAASPWTCGRQSEGEEPPPQEASAGHQEGRRRGQWAPPLRRRASQRAPAGARHWRRHQSAKGGERRDWTRGPIERQEGADDRKMEPIAASRRVTRAALREGALGGRGRSGLPVPQRRGSAAVRRTGEARLALAGPGGGRALGGFMRIAAPVAPWRPTRTRRWVLGPVRETPLPEGEPAPETSPQCTWGREGAALGERDVGRGAGEKSQPLRCRRLGKKRKPGSGRAEGGREAGGVVHSLANRPRLGARIVFRRRSVTFFSAPCCRWSSKRCALSTREIRASGSLARFPSSTG